ncbi:MAG: dienelactone hydrolase family protein [Pseudomonadota bacterium]
MTEHLNAKRRGPASGTARSLVIFLHGYGADGSDLLGLADPLAPHMQDTVFVAPDAPERSAMNPMGFQWFPIPWIDGSSETEAGISMARSADLLDAWLDAAMDAEGVPASRTILFGFSQGTMMSLHVGPRRAEPLAGIVGFSGRLMVPDRLDETVSKPPILLVHGDADDVVSFDSMGAAEAALTGAGFDVASHVMPGTGHGIAPDGLSAALSFMVGRLDLH